MVSKAEGGVAGRLTVQVEAAPITVHNYTLDVEDPSCGLRLTLGRMLYAGRVLLNRPAPRPVLPTMSKIAAKRCGPVSLCIARWLVCARARVCVRACARARACNGHACACEGARA